MAGLPGTDRVGQAIHSTKRLLRSSLRSRGPPPCAARGTTTAPAVSRGPPLRHWQVQTEDLTIITCRPAQLWKASAVRQSSRATAVDTCTRFVIRVRGDHAIRAIRRGAGIGCCVGGVTAEPVEVRDHRARHHARRNDQHEQSAHGATMTGDAGHTHESYANHENKPMPVADSRIERAGTR